MSDIGAAEWNGLIAGLPGAHLLQTWEWGQIKAQTGWCPLPQIWRDEQGQVRGAAMVLRRAVPGGLSVLYVPRGPLVDWSRPEWSRRVLAELQQLARRQGAIFIKIDPELVTGRGVPGGEDEQIDPDGQRVIGEMSALGWHLSADQIQFRNTVFLDLEGDEAQLLARMKQKTRYNIRLAERKGVKVRPGGLADLPMLYRMYAETSVRDGFVIRGEDYYQAVWRAFMEKGMAEPLIAEVDGEPVAGLVLFSFAGRAWYLYGMSRDLHRDWMPNYLLQWEAMRWAKARGCHEYDLWGAPDHFDESDSMWGVFRFKEGLGGRVVRTAGAWDFPSRPLLYTMYTRLLPRLLDIMRRRGRKHTQDQVSL